MWIYVLIAVVVLILIYGFITFNSLVKFRNSVREAFSTMDVYLKKRWDLVPNLVETVKGYLQHEQNTLAELTTLRAESYDGLSDQEKVEVNTKLSQSVAKLLAVAEAYPDLKANTNFLDLSAQLQKVEEDIANSRKYYNGAVKILNNKVEMFPSNLVALICGFKQWKMFEVDEAERENVKVEF